MAAKDLVRHILNYYLILK